MARNAELYPTDKRGSDSPQFGEAIDELDERVQVVEGGGIGNTGILVDDVNGTQYTDTSTAKSAVLGSVDNNTYIQVYGDGETSDDVTLTSSGDIDIAAAGQITIANSKLVSNASDFILENLPTSDPASFGQLWVDASAGYALKVSQG